MKFNKNTIPFIVTLVAVSVALNIALSRGSLPRWEVDALASFIAVLVAMPLLKLNRNK